ncbi:hypothetical protein Tco_1279479 [Tanacetum coccineum]
MVQKAVLMKYGLKPFNTVRQVNVAHTKSTMNVARPMKYFSKPAHSYVNRPINKQTTFKNRNFDYRVNAVKRNVNTARSTVVTYTNSINRVSAASLKVTTTRPNEAVLNAIKGKRDNCAKASACWDMLPLEEILKEEKSQEEVQLELEN